MSKKHTERGFDRLVNFSDAVVAIAITLLVLPLIDLLNDESASDDFAQFLVDNGWAFGNFVIAFLVLSSYWRLHHNVFESLNDYDGWLMRLSILWLMFVVLLPFMSASLSQTNQAAALMGFLLVLAALSAILGTMSAYARSRPQLLAPDAEYRDFNVRRYWWFAAFEVAVALFAWWGAASGSIGGTRAALALLLLFPLGLISEWSHERAMDRKFGPETSEHLKIPGSSKD